MPVLRRRFLAPAGGPTTWRGLGAAGRSCDLFWARNALHLGLRLLDVAPRSRVLVPAYICRSVPEAVLAHGAEVEFYRVDGHCRLDLDDLVGRLRAPVSAVIAVHYFGLPQPDMRALRTLCDERGVVLIEDCAHVLPTQAGPGSPGFIGHASIFSWRKFLPIFDGGTLVLDSDRVASLPRPGRAPLRLQLRACKDTIDRLRTPPMRVGGGEARPGHRHGASTLGVGNSGSGPTPTPRWRIDPNGDAFRPQAVGLPMTHASGWIRDRSDLAAVAEARRRNWRALAGLLPPEVQTGSCGGELPPGVVPWVLPLRLDRASDPCASLRKLGIPAAAWSGVRPAGVPLGLHPQADRLYDTLVFLPVHQDLSDQHVAFIANGVQSML